MTRVNLDNTNPLTPQSAGFPTPYTSISSATFQAMTTGNDTR